MSNTVSQILDERKKTHGEFKTHAEMAQYLKRVVRMSPNAARLSDAQMEAMDMIFHKCARVLNGDPNHKDHWDDIAGYAQLVSRELEKAASGDVVGSIAPSLSVAAASRRFNLCPCGHMDIQHDPNGRCKFCECN